MTPSREATESTNLLGKSSWEKKRKLFYRCEWLQSHPPFIHVVCFVRTNHRIGHIRFTPRDSQGEPERFVFKTMEEAHQILDTIETFCQ